MKKLTAKQVLTEKGVIKTAVRTKYKEEVIEKVLELLEELGAHTCERGIAIPLVEDNDSGEVIINAVLELVITNSDINKKYVRKSKSTKKEETQEEVVSLF